MTGGLRVVVAGLVGVVSLSLAYRSGWAKGCRVGHDSAAQWFFNEGCEPVTPAGA